MSAIERAAVERTSTKVSSISRMIIRIIRAGSSARSSKSVILAAKMSRARLNTGPLSQAATGASRDAALCGAASGCLSSRATRTGTFASMISSSAIDADLDGGGDGLCRTDRCADRDGAHGERTDDGDQGASELRLRRHDNLPFPAAGLLTVR